MIQLQMILSILQLFAVSFGYDISWSLSTELPHPLYSAAVGVNKDHSLIYTLGGLNSSTTTSGYVSYIYQFNGTYFKNIGSIPKLYHFHCYTQCSTTINDIIYFAFNREIYRYNTTSVTFTSSNVLIPFVDKTRGNYDNYLCLTSNNTHLFVVESQNCSSSSCINLQVYDTQNDIWYSQSNIARNEKIITAAGCSYYKGIIYGFGGEIYHINNYSQNAVNLIMIYNFTANEWSISNLKLNANGVYLKVIMPNDDGIFYIFQNYGSKVDIFDANKMIITSTTPRLNGSNFMMTQFMNQQIYVIGGTCHNVSRLTEVSSIIPTFHPTQLPSKSPTILPTNNKLETSNFHITMLDYIIITAAFFVCGVLIYCVKTIRRKYERDNNLQHALVVNNSNEGMVQQNIVDTMHA